MSSRPDATPVADASAQQRRARGSHGQQRRAVVTRHGLLEAAGEHFASTGYHGTSLREILEACGVTKGALYVHFPSKQALVEAIIGNRAEVDRDGRRGPRARDGPGSKRSSRPSTGSSH